MAKPQLLEGPPEHEIAVRAIPRPSRGQQWVRLALGLAISAGALWLAGRHVDWAVTWQVLAAARLPLLLAAILVQCTSYLLSAARWQALFPEPAAVPVFRLVQVLLVAQLVNTALPFRLGPLARASLVGTRDDQGIALTLTTVAGEKLLETLTLAAGLVLTMIVLPLPPWVQQAGLTVALLSAGALVIVLALSHSRQRLEGWLVRLGGRVAGTSMILLEVMGAWLKPVRAGQLILWTAALWLLGTGVNLLVLLALGLPGRADIALVLLVLLQLGARVPGAPANLGLFESLCVAGLAWFGVAAGPALSYGLALHAVVLLPGLLGGAWALWHDAVLRARLRHATQGELA
jgi:uncharacterized membrane protein YbhN (UPF0104 family)